MTALEKPEFISVSEYLAGEKLAETKHEYVGGTVHAMAGATNRHNAVAVNALVTLGGQLRGKTCRPYNSDTKVRIEYPDHTRFYYPDAMVVCRSNPDDDHFQENPVVIIEVLSPSTRRTDLEEKRDAYLTMPSLRVLLLVDPDATHVTVYRRRSEGGFGTDVITSVEAVIPLPEIEAALALADLYEGVGKSSADRVAD